MDPLAEDYAAYNPYNYVLNNPLKFVDPDGMSVDDPPKNKVHANQITNSFSYDDVGKTQGTDNLQQTVVSTTTFTNDNGEGIAQLHSTVVTTANVDADGNNTGTADVKGYYSVTSTGDDGVKIGSEALFSSKTVDLESTSSEFQAAVRDVQDFKQNNKLSPVQAEGRAQEATNKKSAFIGGGVASARRLISKAPHPAAKLGGALITGVGSTIATVPAVLNETNPEKIKLRTQH